jgi:hypothetical protein
MLSETLPRALPRDVPDYHAREAAHWRALAESTADRFARSRLLEEAEQHARLAATDSAVPIHGEEPSAKAGRLRRCAARARRLADQTHARELCRPLLALATDYERMAQTYELQAANI